MRVESLLRLSDNRLTACVMERVDGPGESPVVNGDDAHAGNAVDDLVREPPRHETRANYSNADRSTGSLALLKFGIEENHLDLSSTSAIRVLSSGSISASGFHCRSFSDI